MENETAHTIALVIIIWAAGCLFIVPCLAISLYYMKKRHKYIKEQFYELAKQITARKEVE